MPYAAPSILSSKRSILLAAALGAVLVAPAPPAGPGVKTYEGGAPSQPAAKAERLEGGSPSIEAEEYAAHLNDPIAFPPGEAAVVPFSPLSDDRWSVGGGSPVSLPGATASGHDLARERTGDVGAPAAALADVAPARVSPNVELTAFVGSRKQVIGFLPYWELGTGINYRVVTTVAYFAVDVDANGNLRKTNSNGSPTPGWAGWTSSAMTQVINAAHSAGSRVVLSVTLFAWDTAGRTAQAAFLNSGAAQLNLARQIAAAVRARGADGVNVDFEPIVSGGGAPFAAFIRTLRAQLNAVAPGYQLTVDATGYVGNYPLSQLGSDGAMDAVLVMGYDFRDGTAANAGSIDPLPSATVYDVGNAVDAFTAKLPASKVILGLPWYGRAWSTVSNGLRAATHTNATYGASVTAYYDVAADIAAQHGKKYDSSENSAWAAYYGTWGTAPTWRQLYWDDPTAEGVKANLVLNRGLRGAGIWALGYEGDHPDLYNVLAAKFPASTSVSFSYPPSGTTRIVTATSNTISWAISAPPGVRSTSLVEQYGTRVAAGSCAGVTWRTAWTRTGQKSPLALTSFGTNLCYRWKLTVTDNAGKTVSAWSGNLLVATVPKIAWTFPPAGKTSNGGWSNYIRWSATDPAGIASSSLTEWYGRASAGSCNGIGWTAEWTASYKSPLYSYGFLRGYCYHYLLRVKSGNGISAESNSGNLYIP